MLDLRALAQALWSSPEVRRGLILFGLIALIGLSAPLWVPYDPNEQLDPYSGRLRAPGSRLEVVRLDDGRTFLADSVTVADGELVMDRLGRIARVPVGRVANLSDRGDSVAERRRFWAGTDKLGRDVLSRWALGAHVSLLVGVLAVALAMTVGVLVGAAAALGPRWLDGALMRAVDGLLAFPTIFLLLALSSVVPRGTVVLVLLLGGVGWMGVSRLARAEIASCSRRDFVLAARGLGASESRIFFRHILPNVLTPLSVAATFRIGSMILAEAALSYLDLGIAAPNPSWGSMISNGRSVLSEAWWIAGLPAISLVLTVVAVTLMADGLRDALDPRKAAAL